MRLKILIFLCFANLIFAFNQYAYSQDYWMSYDKTKYYFLKTSLSHIYHYNDQVFAINIKQDPLDSTKIFNRIGILSDSLWYPIGDSLKTGANGSILDLKGFNNKLYVSGNFDSLGSEKINNFGYLNLDSQNWVTCNNSNNIVFHTFDVIDSVFYLCGSNPFSNYQFYTWNGSVWDSIASKVTGRVKKIKSFGDSIIVVGDFDSCGSVPAKNIAFYNTLNDTWHSYGEEGPNGIVNNVFLWNEELIFTGNFSSVTRATDTLYCYNIVVKDENSWNDLEYGLNGSILDILTMGDSLIVAGIFDYAGERNCNNIALWNGFNWVSLGEGTDLKINRIQEVDGDIIVSGNFNYAGGKSSPNIAILDLQAINMFKNVNSFDDNIRKYESCFKIYPTPVNTFFELENLQDLYINRIEIYSYSGSLLETVMLNKEEKKVRIDCNALQSGYYFVKIFTNNTIFNTKIIISR